MVMGQLEGCQKILADIWALPSKLEELPVKARHRGLPVPLQEQQQQRLVFAQCIASTLNG